ncbi:MAG: Na+/H+ antiporter NhaD [Chloroflexi bacterium]|jgi:Na+/H+ antiporter NhaD/arsenite permease-like protein|nr:MAG: Na+/H+ antiporter NhaD [Chloroflexota bacterium]
MIIATVIFGITYLAIAMSRIPSAIIAILGATTMVTALAIASDFTPHEALQYIDLEVILLLAGMMILADVMSRTGAFEWTARHGARLVKGNGFLLIILLSFLTAIGSALLDNVTTVVIMVPITLSLCKSLDLNPIPFLLAEVFASNVGGTATIVGDPPNIIIASQANISFSEFFINIAPVSALSLCALFILLYLWFKDSVKVSPLKREQLIHERPANLIKDSNLLKKSLFVFTLTIIGFFFADQIGISPAFVAIGGAALVLLFSGLNPGEVLKEVEWTTLCFFAGLFMLVGGLEHVGIIDHISEWIVSLSSNSDGTITKSSERNLSIIMVWLSGGLSAFIDNIPFATTMAPVVSDLLVNKGSVNAGSEVNPLWWALILGADLGGNFTIVGASANVVVFTMARASGYPISFFQFFKYGACISVVSLAISCAYLLLRYY